jgi:hypothetical protein
VPGRTALPMIASGAMRKPHGQAGVGISRGWRVAGCFGEYCTDRVWIVDGEFCCLRPGAVLARARQAKGRAQNAAKRSGGQAARPPVAARCRALKGPVLSGLMLGLLDGYTGGRWGELAGQTPAEYDALRQAIAVFEPLKEVDGRLLKSGADVTDRVAPSFDSGARRPRRIKRNARTKSPAGERWVQLPPTLAMMYELLLATRPAGSSIVFTSLQGKPW